MKGECALKKIIVPVITIHRSSSLQDQHSILTSVYKQTGQSRGGKTGSCTVRSFQCIGVQSLKLLERRTKTRNARAVH